MWLKSSLRIKIKISDDESRAEIAHTHKEA